MKIVRKLTTKVQDWAKHQYAPYYLTAVSFAESSFFPIPPDVMLIPMIIAQPHKKWFYTILTIIASILGGILGYLLGSVAFEIIGNPLIKWVGEKYYWQAVSWFEHYGFFTILMAGFIPIPYKIFTLAAGASHMALAPFVIASLFGRSLRFFSVVSITHFLKKQTLKAKWVIMAGILILVALAYWQVIR